MQYVSAQLAHLSGQILTNGLLLPPVHSASQGEWSRSVLPPVPDCPCVVISPRYDERLQSSAAKQIFHSSDV